MGLKSPFDPASFVLLRYCTRPYSFMRVCAIDLAAWLDRFDVRYTIGYTRETQPKCLYFTPLDEWQRYLSIDKNLAMEMRLYKQDITEKVQAVRMSRQISKYQSAPSISESALMLEYADISPIHYN